MQPHKNVTNSLSGVEQTSLASSKPATKDTFQVKSGIWADSLSRGLIDLNIAARKFLFIFDMTSFVIHDNSCSVIMFGQLLHDISLSTVSFDGFLSWY